MPSLSNPRDDSWQKYWAAASRSTKLQAGLALSPMNFSQGSEVAMPEFTLLENHEPICHHWTLRAGDFG